MSHLRSWTGAAVAAVVLALLTTVVPGGASAVGSAAGKPAPVKITLKSNGTGRVVSDRDGCVREVDVFAFFRASNGDISPAGQTTTDAQGRYPTGGARRGVAQKAFTFVLGTAKCRVAQSDDVSVVLRAGQPAKRRVSLQVGATDLSGRVTSKRSGCLKNVPVEIFAVLSPGAPWTDLGTLMTDNQGRYSTADARLLGLARGGADARIAAVTFGDKTCRVAQSPTRTLG